MLGFLLHAKIRIFFETSAKSAHFPHFFIFQPRVFFANIDIALIIRILRCVVTTP